MPSATMTSKGQITVPVEIRRALRLEVGDRVDFLLREDGVVEMKPGSIDLRSLYGCLASRRGSATLDEMERAIAEGATEE
jgi:AbrB family looped-hinge helix DNA binding protein